MITNINLIIFIMACCISNALSSCLKIDNVICETTDTEIYSGMYYGKKCIIKKINLDSIVGVKPKIVRELSVLSNVKNEYIVKLYGVYYDDNSIYIILESGQETILDTNKDKLNVKSTIKNVISGLKALNDNNYIHGDLSFKNIVKFKNNDTYVFKLIDFGLSIKKYRKSAIMSPTIYISPCEFIEKKEICISKIDSWAVGCLYYYIKKGVIPSNKTPVNGQKRQRNKTTQKRKKHKGSSCSVFNKLINSKAKNRCGITEAYEKLFNTNKTVHIFNTDTMQEKINMSKGEILMPSDNTLPDTLRYYILTLLLQFNMQNCIPVENIFITLKLLPKLKNMSVAEIIGNSLLLYFLTSKLVSNVMIKIDDIANILNTYAPKYIIKNVNFHMLKILELLNWNIDVQTLISYTSNIKQTYTIKYLLISIVVLCHSQYDIFDINFLSEAIIILIKCSSGEKIDGHQINNKYQMYYAIGNIIASIKNMQIGNHPMSNIIKEYCKSIGFANFETFINFDNCFEELFNVCS